MQRVSQGPSKVGQACAWECLFMDVQVLIPFEHQMLAVMGPDFLALPELTHGSLAGNR